MERSRAQAGSASETLCRVLGIERPVLLAPMAKIAGGRLAAAVSAAGGLGIVGAGYGDPDWLGRQMASVAGRRVGIGLITWAIDLATVESVLRYRPAAVWLAFGDPTPYLPAIHAAGVPVVCQVGTVGEARAAAAAGADVLVAQGTEAGGHGRPNLPIVEAVVAVTRAVPHLPVVAAGGIVGRSDLDAVAAAGAAGVAIGTALYATVEAEDSDAAKRRIVDAGPGDTVRSVVYDLLRGPEWPPGYTGRSLRSALTDRWVGRIDELRAVLDAQRDAYERAAEIDDVSLRVVWAGEGSAAVDRIVPAAEVVRRFPKV